MGGAGWVGTGTADLFLSLLMDSGRSLGRLRDDPMATPAQGSLGRCAAVGNYFGDYCLRLGAVSLPAFASTGYLGRTADTRFYSSTRSCSHSGNHRGPDAHSFIYSDQADTDEMERRAGNICRIIRTTAAAGFQSTDCDRENYAALSLCGVGR